MPGTSKTEENVDPVKESVHKNRRINIHKVANILGISSGLVQSTLKHCLNMHSMSAKFVPGLLSEREEELCQHVPGPSREV
jgi:hypothetical protein